MIVADKGKHIRNKNDVKTELYTPHYSTTIFVPDSFTEEQMYEQYIEEEIKN
jgi:hypothetical protein